jgi:hypothetical protein
MVVDERDERVGMKFVALGCRTSTRFVSPLRSPDWGQSVSKVPCGCSAAIFPGCTTPLLTSHATFLRVSFPYPSMPTSIRSDLRPSAVIPYPHFHSPDPLRPVSYPCPCLFRFIGEFLSFLPSSFHLLYLCLLHYPLCVCPRFHLADSDYFRLPFFLLRLTVSGMPGL